jgi:hypothetical protein
MFRPGLSVKEQLEELEAALDLDWTDQDWGIVNAAAGRVPEFVSFFEQNYDKHWSPWTVAEFVDLVMESASDAVRSDPHFSAICIDGFVARAAPVAPDRFAYWTSHDWPITPHLRELGL